MRAGFDDLEFVEDEVFPQAGEAGFGGCNLEVAEAALEEFGFGEDAEAGGACSGEFARERCGVEGFANDATGGRGFFHFGDDRRFADGAMCDGVAEAAGCVFGGELFKRGDAGSLLGVRDALAGGVEDEIELRHESMAFPQCWCEG